MVLSRITGTNAVDATTLGVENRIAHNGGVWSKVSLEFLIHRKSLHTSSFIFLFRREFRRILNGLFNTGQVFKVDLIIANLWPSGLLLLHALTSGVVTSFDLEYQTALRNIYTLGEL